jgi:hypothetical protein
VHFIRKNFQKLRQNASELCEWGTRPSQIDWWLLLLGNSAWFLMIDRYIFDLAFDNMTCKFFYFKALEAYIKPFKVIYVDYFSQLSCWKIKSYLVCMGKIWNLIHHSKSSFVTIITYALTHIPDQRNTNKIFCLVML